MPENLSLRRMGHPVAFPDRNATRCVEQREALFEGIISFPQKASFGTLISPHLATQVMRHKVMGNQA